MFQLILVYLQLLWAILFINTDTKLVKNALVRQWKCGFDFLSFFYSDCSK